MKRYLITVALALFLLSFESVLIKQLQLDVTRIDVVVAIVAFLAVRATTLEGAFTSFTLGYLVDAMSGRPTGLYTFLAVLVFLFGRVAASLVDVRSVGSYVLFAMAADFGHNILAVFFSWLTSTGQLGANTFSTMPLQVVLTGIAAYLLYPLLRKLDPAKGERIGLGALR